jgi:nitrile hydratase accessory protein
MSTARITPDRLRLPGDAEGPAFAEPWQAQAFALAVELERRGAFAWDEWVTTLAAEIAAHPAAPGEDACTAHYRQWLAALEGIVASKSLSSAEEMRERKEAWRLAYLHTPHGQPVELRAAGHDAAI